MYKGPAKNVLNMNNLILYPAALQQAITLSGLTWGMPRAQYYVVQSWAFLNCNTISVVKTEAKEEAVRIRVDKPYETTLMGMPIELDDSLPPSTIQLRWQGAVLYEIQNIVIPADF